MQEQINKKETDLRQLKLKLQQLEGKAKHAEELEREIATLKTFHAQEIGRIQG